MSVSITFSILCLLAALVNSIPLNSTTLFNSTSLGCMSDGPVQALQRNLDSAETFCGAFAGHVKPSAVAQITEAATTTSMSGSTTVTVTNTTTLILTMTEEADYAPSLTTTTITQATCSSTVAAAIVPIGRGGGKRDEQIPSYLTRYQSAQISSACTCLASTQAQATATTTVTTTFTGSTDTVTQTHMTTSWGNTQILLGGGKRVIVETACVTG